MLIQEQLKQQAGFSDVERSIADFILAQGAGLKQLSARQIAAEAYVSPSSVVRLCQKLGYDGYNAFQDAWLAEQEYLSSRFQDLDANHPFDPGEPITVIARKLGALYRETIYERVWGGDFEYGSKTVDLHVQRLRKKVGWTRELQAVNKVGYRLEVKG